MRINSRLVIVIFIIILTSLAHGQKRVTRSSGGSIKTKLAYGIVLNNESTLEREWITIHNSLLPADFIGTVGIITIYELGEGYSSGEYIYKANYIINAQEALSAIEVRFLTFDVWGNHIRTLSSTDIVDLPAGRKHVFDAKWPVYSENEVSQFYASIAYIAQVITAGGRIIKTNPNIIIEEARKFSSKFTEGDLEPNPDKK